MTTLLQRSLRSFASTLGGQFATESPGQLLRIIQQAPALVSLDWHQDLCGPDDKEGLSQLDLKSNKEVALYSWAGLNPNNDGQITAAVYLNHVGNVYVHCRQGAFDDGWEDEYITDIFGNTHSIRKFKTYAALEKCLLRSEEKDVYFDIDLDFFTINNPYNGKGKKYTYLKDKEIAEMFDPARPIIDWIFKRLCGFTIAVEPEHTGGLTIATKYLNIINNSFFAQPLFTNHGNDWDKGTDWRHLKNS